ncbi:MAG: amino acid racemase [Gammaproteobacteria bacterium]
MKTIGLIGGCSYESTAIYYSRINELIRAERPGHGARLLLWSFDIDDIQQHIDRDEWPLAAEKFAAAARWLEDGGADCVLICTNTMHRIAPEVVTTLRVPLINLVDVAAQSIKRAGSRAPLLLGTRYTMEQAFYRDQLLRAGLDVRVPDQIDRAVVHDVIYRELMNGVIREESRHRLMQVIQKETSAGADSVILACTELGMLIHPQAVDVPVTDTLEAHARAAVKFALG